ncbi:MAG TPA: energy transducer TonB [Thermoanaerobaculia bacterium]|nr:energy transducer TonB [Thermoanaerobaculia bacterium]
MRSHRNPATGIALGLFLAAAGAVAQTRGAVQTKQVNPVYPDNLLKTQKQGNVIIVGRIDASGHLQDLHVLSTQHRDFSAAALDAVKQWQFRPAMKDGKPVEVFANIVVRFRLQSEKRGAIAEPILGDLAVKPADAAGKATAPEGFPIQKGKDAALRAEVLLDVPPSPTERTLAVRLEAMSPSGKRVPIFQPPIVVPAKATEVRFAPVVPVGETWEEGAWLLRFTVNDGNAGGGQFWLARDPAHFHFYVPKT